MVGAKIKDQQGLMKDRVRERETELDRRVSEGDRVRGEEAE